MTQKSALILREYMRTCGLNQRKTAEFFEVATYSIRKYLNGHNIHPRVAERMEKTTKGVLKAYRLVK